MMKSKLRPVLRFKEFEGNWVNKPLHSIGKFSKGKGISKGEIVENGLTECIRYGELYTHYNELINDIKSRTNTDPNELILSEANDVIIPASGESQIDIAKASCVLKAGVALGGDLNIIKTRLNGVFLAYYLNNAKRTEIAKLAQGISVVHLYAHQLRTLKLNLPPTLKEEDKIAAFLSSIDTKIQQLSKKKELLEQYKKGVMQKIFKQEIRFKDENGKGFPRWDEIRLSEVLFEHRTKSSGKEEVFSVSVHKGLVNQIEHLGRSFAASSTDHYNLVKPNDIVYTKSPTGDFPYGIIKQSLVNKNVIVSPLYGVFTPETPELGYMLNVYFESVQNVYNYLHSIIQKGAKNTINITNETFLSKKMILPVSKGEQQKIGTFFKAIDTKIGQVSNQLDQVKRFKKGLLQQMLV